MGLANIPLHNCTLVTTSAAIKATPGTIWAINLIPAAAKGLFKLTDDANGSGATVVSAQVAADASSVFIDFTPLGGVQFPTKIYATISGTGAVAQVWWD